MAPTVVVAIDRPIESGLDGLRDIPASIAYDADHFVDIAAFFGSEVLSDGILIGEQGLCGGAADHPDLGTLQALIQGKDAAAQKRDLNGGKVARLCSAHHHVGHFPFGQWRMFDHLHHAIAIPTFTWRRAH